MQQQEVWDGNWKLMDHDLATGRSVWVTVQDGKTIARIDMPNDKLEDIFAVNHEFAAARQGNKLGEWSRIASMPHHLAHSSGLAEANREGDQKFINRWLNDSDHRKFRTGGGRV